jgi:ribonuclease HII
MVCDYWHEGRARKHGYKVVAGIDEVGRGCLFGPVVAAAVVLHPTNIIVGLDDSKRLSRKERERLDAVIRRQAVGIGIGSADASCIDRLGIMEAVRIAMTMAALGLPVVPDYLFIDYMRVDHLRQIKQDPVVHGDAIVASIAAASIVAKVCRDRQMENLDPIWPEYGIARNKGYGTVEHLRKLREYGPTPMHRMTFAGVKPKPPVEED